MHLLLPWPVFYTINVLFIIFSFPSEQDAHNWWNDDGYQELSKHRRAATEITLQKVKGMLPRT